MNKKNFRVLCAITCMIFMLSSCKKEKCVEPIKPPVIVDTTTVVKTVTFLLNGNYDTIAKINCTGSVCDTVWFQPSNQGLNGCWAGYSETPYYYLPGVPLCMRGNSVAVMFRGQNVIHDLWLDDQCQREKDGNGDHPYKIQGFDAPTFEAAMIADMNRTSLNFSVISYNYIGGSYTIITQDYLCR